MFPSYLKTKLKCSRLAKINASLKRNQEEYVSKQEKLKSNYSNMNNVFAQESSELKTILLSICWLLTLETEDQLIHYKKECKSLEKQLKEDNEKMQKYVKNIVEMNKKIEVLKKKTKSLKEENDLVKNKLKELIMSIDVSRLDESIQNSFALPKDAKAISSHNSKMPEESNIQECLQVYAKQISTLTQKIKTQRAQIREQKQENDNLRTKLEDVRNLDAIFLDNLKLEIRIKRIKLKQFIFKSFSYLTAKDLIRVSMVCAEFYSQSFEYLSDSAHWKLICPAGFQLPRNRLWLSFIKHQFPHDKEFLAFYQRLATAKHKPSPSEETKITHTEGFFDYNYAFLSNLESVHGEGSGVIDYSLMNADSARCDPEEVFSPDFLKLNQYNANDRTRNTKEEIELILMDIQRLFGFSHYRQGMTFVVYFLHIVMKRRRLDVYRVLNVLLEEPYYLKKLYSDDFYLLNLIIFQTDFLLKQKIPELYFCLNRENILLHDFMVSWIMTLFTYQVLGCVEL
eukprot:TRINITY_DN4011_c0_g1_i12.p1 TRINITY_DN4011_c0_g1~~TRINITY_DN4011_c0_g1_i12.p1  ORF type:complete len:511 (+),score=144.41 TRINITY_DN4011_c0_g1_i12:689-2221(+)